MPVKRIWLTLLLTAALLSCVCSAAIAATDGNLDMPIALTVIEDEAFSGNSSLTEIVVSDNVTTIGDAVFSNCANLRKIYVPESVTKIGKNAFATGRSDTLVMVLQDSYAHEWCVDNNVAFEFYVTNPVTVRALSVYEVSAPGCSDIPTQERDSAMIERMLLKANPAAANVESITNLKNASKSAIINAIKDMAKTADENDVTFYNMFCHGDDSITNGVYAGAMALSDGNWMTFQELANLLDDIPGRVVIVLLSCGSGSSIDRAAGARSVDDGFDGDAFASEFIRVISEHDKEITIVEAPKGNYAIMPATGELKKEGKFYVITAARGGESGIYSVFNYEENGITYEAGGFSHLIKWMYDGVVMETDINSLFNLSYITNSNLNGPMSADANSDNIVTLGEMETWLNTMSANNLFDMGDPTLYQMRPQVYPTKSDFELFIRY